MHLSDSTVIRISTIWVDRLPNEFWLEIETADGRVGLGETYGLPATLASYVHEAVAPYLLGKDASAIERHWWALYRNWGPAGIGIENRALSAVDIALWDLLGQGAGLPLYTLLGGAVRDGIRAYNTCGGPEYGETLMVPGADMRGIGDAARRYEDLWAQQHEPEQLAESLLEMGITAMKVWPFDPICEENGGRGITAEQLHRGAEPIRRIRAAVGDRMDVAIELHMRWDLASAIAIARTLEPYEPMWFEDPMPSEDVDAFGIFARSTRIPTLAGENLGTFGPFGDMITRGGIGIVMADPSYVGGITPMHRVADLAGQHMRSFTSHDCSGPVNLAVGTHLALHAENAVIQEMVRAFYFGWYDEFVTGQPELTRGVLRPPATPGHGVRLRPGVSERADAHVRTASMQGL
jgi:L-alanine-DL-glutamate epimerase-like enolase superfamily enzyme